MNTLQEVKDFLSQHIKPSQISDLHINRFLWDRSKHDLKDKFYTVIRIPYDCNDVKTFEAKLINVVTKTKRDGLYEYQYHVIVTKDELVRMLSDLRTLYVIYIYHIYYFTINYETHMKAITHISDNFKINAPIISARIPIDETAFYVIVDCNGNENIDTHYELLSNFCDSIEYSMPGSPIDILYAKNVNKYFMPKLKLISESLGSGIFGLILGSGFYQTFED